MSITNEDVLVYDTTKQNTTKKQIKTFDLVDPTSPILNQKLEEFRFDTPPVNANEFASMLVETCKKHNGLGLSANQCGFPYRVFVMGFNEDFIACFNPKVLKSEGEIHMPEGCLSFPLLQLNITRPKKITVEYQDWNGIIRTSTFDGLTARVFLHELDHMDGIVYTAKAKPLALQNGFKKMKKIKRKYFNQVMKQVTNDKTNTTNR